MTSVAEHQAMTEIAALLKQVAPKSGQVSFSREERSAFDQIGAVVAQFQVDERAKLDGLLELTPTGRAVLADRREREQNTATFSKRTIDPKIRGLIEETELGRSVLRDIEDGR